MKLLRPLFLPIEIVKKKRPFFKLSPSGKLRATIGFLLLGLLIHPATGLGGPIVKTENGFDPVNKKPYLSSGTDHFWMQDGNFVFLGTMAHQRSLHLITKLKDKETDTRSELRGKDLYKQMIEHFGIKNIKTIAGTWTEGTNYDQYMKSKALGLSNEESALSTWSGEMASDFGFAHVKEVVETLTFDRKSLARIEVIFAKSCRKTLSSK